MKKLSLLLGVLIIICFANSCKQSEAVNPVTVQVTTQPSIKVSAMLNIASIDEQKLAYRSLNSSEKTEAWKFHLNQLSKSGLYSKEQNDLLVELQTYINSDFFSK